MEFKISDKMRNMKPSIIREILKQMSDPTLISFAGGNPAADSFPAEDIARFSDELLRQDPVAALQYSVSEGVPSVREAVRAFANRRERVAKETTACSLHPAASRSWISRPNAFATRATWWLWKTPAFLGAFNAFRSSGARLAGVPIGGRRRKPGRAGGPWFAAPGKAARFSTASPISRTPRARP